MTDKQLDDFDRKIKSAAFERSIIILKARNRKPFKKMAELAGIGNERFKRLYGGGSKVTMDDLDKMESVFPGFKSIFERELSNDSAIGANDSLEVLYERALIDIELMGRELSLYKDKYHELLKKIGKTLV